MEHAYTWVGNAIDLSWQDATFDDAAARLGALLSMPYNVFYTILKRDDGVQLLQQYKGAHEINIDEPLSVVIEKAKNENPEQLMLLLACSRPQILARVLAQEIRQNTNPHLLPLFAASSQLSPEMSSQLLVISAIFQRVDCTEIMIAHAPQQTIITAQKTLNSTEPFIRGDFYGISSQQVAQGVELALNLCQAKLQHIAISHEVSGTAAAKSPSKM